MIKKLSISNFKVFGDSNTEIRLAPITLIFGPNSAGKSSLIQSLLLLKQSNTFSHSLQKHLNPRGKFIDFGSISSLVNKHDLSKKIKYSIQFQYKPDSTDIFNFNFLNEKNNKSNVASKLERIKLEKLDQENNKLYSIEFERSPDDESKKINNENFIDDNSGVRTNADIFKLADS
jgi:predicted ATPase